jgi:hypothetical protein
MFLRSSADSIIVHSKGDAANSVTAIPGAFAEVKFEAHASTFMMFYSACENPGCSCADVIVTFIGKSAPKLREHQRMEFGIEFNVNTWQVTKIYGESPITKPLIDEYVAGLNDEQKDHILARYRSFRSAIEKSARFVVSADKIRKGHMAHAGKVFGESKGTDGCGLTRPLLEEHQGKIYRLIDYYCMNPSCKCGDAHVSVIRVDKDAPASDKPWITLRLHFEGKVGVSHVEGSLTSQQAAALIAEWIQKDPALLGDIEERYRRIKDIGKRILGRKKKK